MSYTCPRCGLTSHHPMDERHKYCAACHRFEVDHPSMDEKDIPSPGRTTAEYEAMKAAGINPVGHPLYKSDFDQRRKEFKGGDADTA